MGFKLPDELIFIKNRNLEQKKSNTLMKGKVCVITGATSGVGFEALKQLAKGGANIVMICRNREKANKIRDYIKLSYKVKIDILVADFTSLKQVRKVAKEILDTYPEIHVLINSAGIYSTTKNYTEEGIEEVLCVNHLAPFLFTQLLLDRIKESVPARIIQVNSEGHRFNGLNLNDINWKRRFYTGLRGYGASKTAQLLTVWELAERLKGSNVTINAIHPGDVRTNIGNNNGWLYKCFLHNVTWHLLKEPDIAGEAIYYLASSDEMNNISGRFFHLTIDEKPAPHALDKEKGKKVWDISMEMTGIKNSGLAEDLYEI